MKKAMFIYNPSAGETGVADHLDRIVALYQSAGFVISLHRLTFDDSAAEVVRSLDGSFDHLLVAGGDGTLNYVVNLVKAAAIEIPIGVIPAGTANDFGTLLGMPSDIIKACEAVLSGRRHRVDLGMVNGAYFVNVFSCGLFTDVSQRASTFVKNNFGKIAYYVNGISDLARFHKMDLHIETDGGNYDGRALILFVFNGRTAGNLPIAYLSEIDDGMLDVLLVKGDTMLDPLITAMDYVFSGRRRRRGPYPDGVVHIRCRELRATSTHKEKTDVDGQPGPGFPIDITCEAAALEVIVPK